MKAELDCGCIAEHDNRLAWDYGWWDCPTGHGRQQIWRILEPKPPPLIDRLHQHRVAFIKRHGKRELTA